MGPIVKFRGEYAYLSNFYETEIKYKGHTYLSVEAAFQAQKCPELCEQFTLLEARAAKRYGKQVPLRNDWGIVKDKIMLELVMIKFLTNKEIRDKLLSTQGRTIIEGNTWHDYYWGMCGGKGQNKLGKILMAVRETLIKNGY